MGRSEEAGSALDSLPRGEASTQRKSCA